MVFRNTAERPVKTFCITLPETPGRHAAAEAHFKERGVDVRFIYGINAKKFGLLTHHFYEVDHPGTGYTINAKHTGLNLSHQLMWSICKEIDDDKFLILEDDAEFPVDWKPRMEQAIADAPAETDMLFVGSCNCGDKPREHIKGDVFRIGKQPISFPMACAAGCEWLPTSKVERDTPHYAAPTEIAFGPTCTHAYIVYRKALEKLLLTQRDIWAPIDLALIFRSFPHLNVYTVLPRICGQRGQEIAP